MLEMDSAPDPWRLRIYLTWTAGQMLETVAIPEKQSGGSDCAAFLCFLVGHGSHFLSRTVHSSGKQTHSHVGKASITKQGRPERCDHKTGMFPLVSTLQSGVQQYGRPFLTRNQKIHSLWVNIALRKQWINV